LMLDVARRRQALKIRDETPSGRAFDFSLLEETQTGTLFRTMRALSAARRVPRYREERGRRG
jgi:hypothetical protein